MSDFDNLVNNFFKTYQDRGMKKWAGYYLSNHTQKIEKDEKIRNYQVKERPKQSQIEISEQLLAAFANHNYVNLQLKRATLEGEKVLEISGFIGGYEESTVYIDNQPVNLDEIINIEI